MEYSVRAATRNDAEGMCELLNPIIRAGGSTAHVNPFTPDRMLGHYLAPPLGISCVIAEGNGQVLGFQALEWADPNYTGTDPIPADWAVIASFVGDAARGLGVGRALFAETIKSARLSKALAIDATIRGDNVSGLGFYSALGFVDYKTVSNVALSDGTRVNRISKKFVL